MAKTSPGVGIVKLPLLMLIRRIEPEALVQVLPGWLPRCEMVHAVFTLWRHLLPAVRALIDSWAARHHWFHAV